MNYCCGISYIAGDNYSNNDFSQCIQQNNNSIEALSSVQISTLLFIIGAGLGGVFILIIILCCCCRAQIRRCWA
jgi:hypothetical protein